MNIISKNQVTFYTVTENDHGQRLDNLLHKLLKSVPQSFIYRIIRSGEVRVNKKRVEAKTKVNTGDIIRIPPVEIKSTSLNKEIIPNKSFPILFEDDYLLIINKPSKIACHGGSGISFGVIELLRHKYSNLKFLELAHRLDRDTSGILVLAKKRQALVGFQASLRTQQVNKYYLALTIGSWHKESIVVKKPLLKYLTSNGERRVKVDLLQGEFAHTIFTLENNFPKDNLSLIKANLKTGKTHQIRVHLQHLNHPIAGDEKYGEEEKNKALKQLLGLNRMFLHAVELNFIHPILKTRLNIHCPLDLQLQQIINSLI